MKFNENWIAHGADSLVQVELVMAIEDEFGIEIDCGDGGKHRAAHEAIADARWNLEIARSVHTTFRDVYTNLRGVHTSSGGAAQPTLSS